MTKKNTKHQIVQVNWWKLGIGLGGFIIGIIIVIVVMWRGT